MFFVFWVYLDRNESFGQLNDARIRECFSIQLTARASPIGVEVEHNRFTGLLGFLHTVLKRFLPTDFCAREECWHCAYHQQ